VEGERNIRKKQIFVDSNVSRYESNVGTHEMFILFLCTFKCIVFYNFASKNKDCILLISSNKAKWGTMNEKKNLDKTDANGT